MRPYCRHVPSGCAFLEHGHCIARAACNAGWAKRHRPSSAVIDHRLIKCKMQGPRRLRRDTGIITHFAPFLPSVYPRFAMSRGYGFVQLPRGFYNIKLANNRSGGLDTRMYRPAPLVCPDDNLHGESCSRCNGQKVQGPIIRRQLHRSADDKKLHRQPQA